MNEIKEKVYFRHDVFCNQKYDNTLPYSFHLKAVLAQVDKFIRIFHPKNGRKWTPDDSRLIYVIKAAAIGHDLIEDARMTYNDVVSLYNCYGEYSDLGKDIAEIIFACTEETGKTREERHNQVFFNRLKVNRLAIFVKLCDIIANVLYSKLTGSSMYDKYQKEFPKLKQQLYIVDEYEDLWKDLEKLLC